MGVENFWKDVLGEFAKSPFVGIDAMRGLKVALDTAIFFNRLASTDVDKLAMTSNPPHPAPDLFLAMKNLHQKFAEVFTPVYVFDGIPPYLKSGCRAKRKSDREKAGAEWLELRKLALELVGRDGPPFTNEEIQDATSSRMAMKHPTFADQLIFLRYCIEEKIECYGSFQEADPQLVQLEKDKVVDAILSTDGDIVVLGARRLFCQMTRKANGEWQFREFRREQFFHPGNPFNARLSRYPQHLVDVALLLGNDYCSRLEGNGPGKVILGSLPRKPREVSKEQWKAQGGAIRRDDSMLDMLASSSDPTKWLVESGWHGKTPMPVDHAERYLLARKYILHAPVLQRCQQTGAVLLVPLNPLPDGVDLAEHLEMPELANAMADEQLLEGLYTCSLLPLTREPVSSLDQPGPLFADLDFEKDPVRCQPKMCLVNWLRARSLDIPLGTPRHVIEKHVMFLLRLQRPVSAAPLQPIVGQHDGYFGIRPRSLPGDASVDHWQTDYVAEAKRCELVTDDVIDRLLGEKRRSRPSIRERVKKLIIGGFYEIQSIKLRKMEIKDNGAPCILFCVNCLSSKTSVMHTVYAVFEDKPGGCYKLDLSSCSCKKGEWFCSHSIGFLHLLGIIQRRIETEDQLLQNYRANPLLLKGSLMLIENVLVADVFKQQKAQRKRRADS